ncbi:MAG: hypothetical protein PHV59_08915 [Victivallales bacterium]|nr:hypothetical protein [Victivallales bacterium]
MKNIFAFILPAAAAIFINGCASSGPAPQNMPLQSPDGKAVIIKDMYELPPLEKHPLSGTEVIRIFFPEADNAKIDFSMTTLKIPSGIRQPKYKQTSSQIIHTVSGGGKLEIGSNIIILKKGVFVYVPPNAEVSITNNVEQILELLIITCPPFKSSQLTLLEEKPSKVAVAKDTENEKDENVDIQTVSERDKNREMKSQRSLSVEEYRNKMYKEPVPSLDSDDSISKLLGTGDADTKTGKAQKDSWPLKMPDSSKVPLKKLEKEQEEELLPAQPQKAENTSLKTVQELTEKEHEVPLRDENGNTSKKKADDELDKLLKEQEQKRRLHPKSATRVKKTSMKNVQELSPEEKQVKPLIKTRIETLKPLNREKPAAASKADKTSLENIQELKPEEKQVKPTNKTVSPLEDLLKEQDTRGVPPKETGKVDKISLENIQELSKQEKAVKSANSKKTEEDPLEKLLEEQKQREKNQGK